MLLKEGFDLWADGYDKSVCLSDENDEYPFAGYKDVLGNIYNTVKTGGGKAVLDIGFGTGVLAKKLYDEGYEIFGMDFSSKMVEIAQEKMPNAKLVQHDFSKGFPDALNAQSFNFITCTYAIHHLDNLAKIEFLDELLFHLAPGGKILIGDVAFATAAEMEACREKAGDEWDDDEIYPVAEILRPAFPGMEFTKISHCAGILEFRK